MSGSQRFPQRGGGKAKQIKVVKISDAPEALFEKYGLGNLFHKIREELGLENMSDTRYIGREDLDVLPWLEPIPKNKLLALISEVQQLAADERPMRNVGCQDLKIAIGVGLVEIFCGLNQFLRTNYLHSFLRYTHKKNNYED